MWNAKDAAGGRDRLNEWYPPFAPMPADPEGASAQPRSAGGDTASGMAATGLPNPAPVTPPSSNEAPPAQDPAPPAPNPAPPAQDAGFAEQQPRWLQAEPAEHSAANVRGAEQIPPAPSTQVQSKRLVIPDAVPETYGDESPPVELGPAPLDYVDDFFGPRTPKAKPKKRGNALIYGGAAAMVALIAGGVALAAAGVFSGSDSTNVGAVVASDATPADLSDWCPSQISEREVTGAGKGSQDDGPSVILAYDYAYYVERDGTKARSLLDLPNPAALTAESLQTYIDNVPVGTQHCLSITPDPTSTGRYSVRLTGREPDGTTSVADQTFTIANRAGTYVITAIETNQ